MQEETFSEVLLASYCFAQGTDLVSKYLSGLPWSVVMGGL